MSESRLFLIHIPKTAGTTINELLVQTLGSARTATHIESRPGFLSSLRMGSGDLRFVSGHLRLPDVLANIDSGSWFLFTILRNPVHQLISHLNWVKALAAPENSARLRLHSEVVREIAHRLWETSLNDVDEIGRVIREDFVEARQLFDNCQVRYLVNHSRNFVGASDAATAVAALDRFDYVGLTEQLTNTCAALSRIVGLDVGAGPLPIVNQAQRPESVRLDDPTICDFYRESVRWDAALYLEAKKRMEGRPDYVSNHVGVHSVGSIEKKCYASDTPRISIITQQINLSGKGVEYGPLHRAILKKETHDVRYVDYADKEALVRHYAPNPNVDTSLIPEIDIVTDGKLITDFLPPQSLDYIVASHVVEHVPDLIGWLSANLAMLKTGGRLSLAYPDKRYCFDIRRSVSTTSELIAAFLEKRTKPNVTQICNHFYSVCHVNAAEAWAGAVTAENAKHIHDREKIFETLGQLTARQDYVDVHCWIFDPESFLKTLNEIRETLKLPFKVISFVETPRNWLEFFITLERT